MNSNHKNQLETSAGVEALIARLRDDGVKQGQEDAARLVDEAQKRADWIINQAQEEADSIRRDAKKNAEELKSGTLSALHQVARDTALNLQDELFRNFDHEVRRLVSTHLRASGALQHLLQVIIAQSCRNAGITLEGAVDALFPEADGQEVNQETLDNMVLEISREMFTSGVELKLGHHKQLGIQLKLKNQGMDIDLTEDNLSDLLLEHLQPKFRNLLQGVSH